MKEKLLKTYFNWYSAIAPKAAANTSFELFQKVRKKDIRPREQFLFDSANHFQLDSPIGLIDTYQIGDKTGRPLLLVHGWDSNAGSMSKIAFDLVEKGFHITLFNLPGHAFYTSDKTNLLECSMAMSAVLEQLKFDQNLSIISHSFGSAVTAMTLANGLIPVDNLIFLTNPNKIEHIFQDFKSMIGINDRAYSHLVEKVENILERKLDDLSVVNNLKRATFNQLYLIHDKYDKVLSYNNSLEIKEELPMTHLESFERIGHYKMLWNDDVIEKCTLFLN